MNIALLGASRGLGLATRNIYQARGDQVLCVSRTAELSMDFSRWPVDSELVAQIRGAQPERLIYFAGGGPFGSYQTKEFKDHQWAFNVCFLFPAFLLHQILQNSKDWVFLRQICFVGSAIAEDSPDPGAASYSAAKHALKGLVTSVQKEEHGNLDLRLFSPGYMDTALLPKNAWPRRKLLPEASKNSSSNGLLANNQLMRGPEDVAESLVEWLENLESINQHQVFE